MAVQTKNNTYFKLAKWFRWASLIIILVPLAMLIINIIYAIKQPEWYGDVAQIIGIITLVSVVLWIILDILLFILAGTIKEHKGALGTRFWLLVALALVFIAEIIDVLVGFKVISIENSKPLQILAIFIPAIIMIGFMIGSIEGKRIKSSLR